MKPLVYLLLLCPIDLWAQLDTLRPIREHLRPPKAIPDRNYESIRLRYEYNGRRVRPAELGRYIYALNDPSATREYEKFRTSQTSGNVVLLVGGLTSIVGVSILAGSGGPGRSTGSAATLGAGLGIMAVGVRLRVPGRRMQRAVFYYNRTLRQRQPPDVYYGAN